MGWLSTFGTGRQPRATIGRLERLRRAAEVEDAGRRALLYFVVPVWLASGLADWICHRRTHIEENSGPRESAIHNLMLIEAGLPAMLGLFLEANAGVLLTVYAGLALHEATVIWDVSYAETRREVTPTEQHVHGFLEVGPVMAAAFLTVLHWDQAKALFGAGSPDFRLRPKQNPLSFKYVAGLLAAIAAFGAGPYAEELVRCLRAKPTLAPQPEPADPATETLRIPPDART